jgi:N-acyl-D-amino-acid deacylase
LKKLLSSTEEKQLLTEALRQEKDEEYWKRCRLVNVPHPRFGSWKNKTVSEIPGDAASNVVEILSFDPVNTQAAFAVMSEENMKRIISLPFCVAGSDGNALPADLRFGQTHPRSFGAVARFLRLNLDMNCPVENSVSRVSGKTAGIFGLKNCGIITPGKVGDMVLFDPDSIDCKGDFSAPATPAEGVVLVIKKGEIIYS